MTETDYITKLQLGLASKADDESFLRTMSLADEAIRLIPRSSRLWLMRGNFIEIAANKGPYDMDEPLECYVRAIDLNPQSVEAWEAAGNFYQTVLGNQAAAHEFFREARRLRRTADTAFETHVARALFIFFAKGGTLKQLDKRLPEFEPRLEAALHGLMPKAQSAVREIQKRAKQFRKINKQKQLAVSARDFEKSANLHDKEIQILKSVGLKRRDRLEIRRAVFSKPSDGQVAELKMLLRTPK